MNTRQPQSSPPPEPGAIPPTRGSLAVGEELRKVAQTQVRTGEPPIAKVTYERLIHEGHSHENAIELIATVLAVEMYEILKAMRPHDERAYAAALRRLPDIP
jgi:hypothetical protein